MPKYIYNGTQTLVFPTLGVVVSDGDQFDGPEGLTAAGVSIVGKGRTTTTAQLDPAPVEDAAPDSTTQGE